MQWNMKIRRIVLNRVFYKKNCLDVPQEKRSSAYMLSSKLNNKKFEILN